ncbi:MAG: flagellar biosynthetic protein FliO [Fuerstiella sp.]|nr:flagellar biosynthetic protein FliO [Fuerstiella sp.]
MERQQQTQAPTPEPPAKTPTAAFLDLTDETQEPAIAAAIEPTHTDMLIRLGTWTVIIMCLCGLTALAIRRWQTKHGILPVAKGQSQIMETVILGPNRSISLVELRGVQALVGCDAGGIQSIVPVPQAFPDILANGEPESLLSPSTETHIESTA